MEIKTVSPNGLDFIVQEEGMILHPYLDSVKIPTIGVGCTYYENGQKVKMTDQPITKERAKQLFANLLDHYELAVYSTTRDDLSQNQFDALVSLCFNIGVNGFKGSTLLKRVNSKSSNDLIQKGFQMWKNAGGKPILLGRRNREYELFIK